jgi:hypothetical protein
MAPPGRIRRSHLVTLDSEETIVPMGLGDSQCFRVSSGGESPFPTLTSGTRVRLPLGSPKSSCHPCISNRLARGLQARASEFVTRCEPYRRLRAASSRPKPETWSAASHRPLSGTSNAPWDGIDRRREFRRDRKYPSTPEIELTRQPGRAYRDQASSMRRNKRPPMDIPQLSGVMSKRGVLGI